MCLLQWRLRREKENEEEIDKYLSLHMRSLQMRWTCCPTEHTDRLDFRSSFAIRCGHVAMF